MKEKVKIIAPGKPADKALQRSEILKKDLEISQEQQWWESKMLAQTKKEIED